MIYNSPNAPKKRDVLGTWNLSILAGHRRYAHVTALRSPSHAAPFTKSGCVAFLCRRLPLI
ncbi:protein of unknown function [Acidithiobacillus ferrivorans]|uniref:Uncharacterized protein n=1 Tax=Acidithiobacillus ferrivorans TaxID=160808 RepID=A0A060UWB9_9PROT|nr:hypothetical protein AFERRI_490004 [Acidithiobacillus ferrivorans]SMH66049.1 protein of unknown function [Acidithiobacillus ferrivorans]